MPKTEERKKNPDKGMLVGSPLEAQTLFKSPYFPESFYFPYNPDPLARGNNYDIYDEMIDDDQVKVALSFKKDAVVNSGWEIECESEAIAKELTESLKRMEDAGKLDMSFEDILRSLVGSGYGYGFAIGEPVWQLMDGKYQYDTVKVRPPHTFRFIIDDGGNVMEVAQSTSKGEKRFKPELFIHYTYQADFGNPYGRSDLRAVHRPWKSKKFISRFLNIYLEKYAVGTLVGKYPQGTDPNEIARLNTVLTTVQQNSVLTVPDNVMVEFVQSQKESSTIYIQALEYNNMLIARGILVPDLMGISGGKTGGGSYSLGEQQFKLFFSTIEKDRQAIARKITLRLIRPWVKANYGDYEAEFKFLPYTADNSLELLKIWVQAASGKLFKPNPEEVNHLRAQLRFPEGPVEASEPAPIPTQEEAEGLPRREVGGESQPEGSGKKREFRFRRALNLYERKVDFDNVRDVLEKNAEGISNEIARILNRMARDLVIQAKERGIVKDWRPEAINSLEPKFRRELNEALKGHFLTLFREAGDEARKELRCPRKLVADDILPGEFEKVIEAEAFKLTGEMSNEVRKRVANKMFDGIKRGLPVSEIAESIFSDLGKYTDAQLRTIVNTKTTEVFNSARMTFFNSDETAQSIIAGYQYSAILDQATTEVCRFLDQKTISVEDMDFIAQAQPALHFNCRSMWVPVTHFEQPTFDKTPSIEKLRDLGAAFLSRKYQLEHPEAPITLTQRFSDFGDHVLIPSPGDGLFVKVLRISCHNQHSINPVTIGFRAGTKDLHYVSTLESTRGQYDKDFGEQGWLLPENSPLVINLSASEVSLSATGRYVVVDKLGSRVR